MESNIKGLVAAGHEMASELKAECGAVDTARNIQSVFLVVRTSPVVMLVRNYSSLITMFGVSPASMIGGNGTPWLVGTSRIEKYQKTFLRHCRPVLQQMLAVYPRLENYVDERNHVAKAWLHWLGFRLEEAAPYGALGLNFHRFHMERK
ncbi:hypothetical protein L3X02_13590 [Escherichia coli]|uniref:hypothetical protein n=1 Tax=Escherichia coli TaxID=562 RepID=UPI001F2AC068|nr:hypothetical protein [Escherichia coli]MCF7239711.1 hypothetical protein [Escherichia coli]MCF7449966.1 hypothetical protein [Escherichia coli]